MYLRKIARSTKSLNSYFYFSGTSFLYKTATKVWYSWCYILAIWYRKLNNKCLNKSISNVSSLTIKEIRQMGCLLSITQVCFGGFFQPGGFNIIYLLHLFCASCVSGVFEEILYVSETSVYFFCFVHIF